MFNGESRHPEVLQLNEVIAVQLLKIEEDFFVRLGLIGRRFHEEDEGHEAVIVLCHKDLFEVAGVREISQSHDRALLYSGVLIADAIKTKLSLVNREEATLGQ